MTYKETLFFIGKCLTINHDQKNKIIIENELKSENIDWESVVKLSTAHYVFPALYCTLKRAEFLPYVPEDLVEFMKHITDLNRERNQKLLSQTKEINELLLVNNITPIFLKGTGNLLEGLYEDIGERMIGDIDFIVSNDDYLKAIEILHNENYKPIKESELDRSFHWHYPTLIHPEKIGAVEIHNKILKRPYSSILSYGILEKGLQNKFNFKFISDEHKILVALLQEIINDNLYYSKRISLRTVYDVFLITQKGNYTIVLNDKNIFKKFNNFYGFIKMILNDIKTLNVVENKNLNQFKTSYIKKLENSKKEKLIIIFIDYVTRQKDRFYILKYALTDGDYRNYAFKRFFKKDFYRFLFVFKDS
jgi:hypothetical protein